MNARHLSGLLVLLLGMPPEPAAAGRHSARPRPRREQAHRRAHRAAPSPSSAAVVNKAESLEYTVPDGPQSLQLASFTFPQWSAGTRLFVAPKRVNLRAEPRTTSPALGHLALGTPVVVQSRTAERQRVDGLVNHWYKVQAGQKSGFVFGGHLTPLGFEADFDGDSNQEVATVGFTAEFKVRVRVIDRDGGTESVSETDLSPAGQGFLGRRGGLVEARLEEAAAVGLPMLHLTSRIEACGDYWESYLSYTMPLKSPGPFGTVRRALQLDGLSDPPVRSSYQVRFQPAEKKAIVERVVVEVDTAGKESTETTTEVFQLKDGVFVSLSPRRGLHAPSPSPSPSPFPSPLAASPSPSPSPKR